MFRRDCSYTDGWLRRAVRRRCGTRRGQKCPARRRWRSRRTLARIRWSRGCISLYQSRHRRSGESGPPGTPYPRNETGCRPAPHPPGITRGQGGPRCSRPDGGSFGLDTLALDYGVDPVRRERRERVDLTAGPVHFDIRGVGLSEPEVHTQIVLRHVAAAAAYFVHLPVFPGGAVNAGAYPGTIRPGADTFHFDPVVLDRRVAAKQLRQIIDTVHHHVQVSVVVEIAHCTAAGRNSLENARPPGHRYSGGSPIAQVVVQDLALAISVLDRSLGHLRIDVPVGHQNVNPAVIIEIQEHHAPPQEPRVLAETGLKGRIFKKIAAEIAIKAGRIAGEVGLDNVELAIAVVIACRHAHAGLRLAIGAVRRAGFNRNVREGAVSIVPVQRRRGRIIGHVNVGPAIVVEIRHEHTETVGPGRFPDPGLFGDVGESAVTVVVEQDVLAAVESRWSARHPDALVETVSRFRNRHGLRIEVDVVGDKEIELAVLVVIEEGTAGVPAFQPLRREACGLRDAGLLRDVRELAVAVVAIQDAIAPVRHKEVVITVVIVVADATTLTPAGARKTRGEGYVSECPVPIVLVKAAGWFVAFARLRLEARAVDQEDVQPSVVVVIEKRNPAARCLQEEPVLLLASEDRFGMQPRFARDVNELHAKRGSCQDFVKRKDRSRPAKRPYERAARAEHRLHSTGVFRAGLWRGRDSCAPLRAAGRGSELFRTERLPRPASPCARTRCRDYCICRRPVGVREIGCSKEPLPPWRPATPLCCQAPGERPPAAGARLRRVGSPSGPRDSSAQLRRTALARRVHSPGCNGR